MLVNPATHLLIIVPVVKKELTQCFSGADDSRSYEVSHLPSFSVEIYNYQVLSRK